MNTLCSWIAAIEQATTRIRDLKEKKKKNKKKNKNKKKKKKKKKK